MPAPSQNESVAKPIESPAVKAHSEVEAPQPRWKGISPTVLNLISVGVLVLCCLLIFFTFKDVDLSRGNSDRVTSLLATIIVRTVTCAALLAWIVRGMTGKRKGYGFLTFSVVCIILVAYNAHYFRIGLNQSERKSQEDVRHSPASSLPVSNAASAVALSATNATGALRVVSGTGFQDMPLGCSAGVVETIMGSPRDKKVYGTEVYYSYKLSNRLTYLERRGLLHNEKDIGFAFDQATLRLKKVFIEDSVAVKTDRGIEFGDPVEKVLKLYGTPTKTSSENIGAAFQGWLAFRNDGITFDFHAGVVTGFDIIGLPK